MLDILIMKPPITATTPSIQEVLLRLNHRRESSQQAQPNNFRKILDIQSSGQQATGASAGQSEQSQHGSSLLHARAEKAGVAKIIQKAAETYNLDPDMVASIIQAQSNFNAEARAPSGAEGLMQLMPATAAELGVTNALDPEQNIMAGSRYLRNLIDRYEGDTHKALMAYKWGMGNVDRNPAAAPVEIKRFAAAANTLPNTTLARHSTANIVAEMRDAERPVTEPAQSAGIIAQKARQHGIDGIIEQAAKAYELHPDLITAVIHAESDFNPNAVSHAGAQGLMQLMPATAAELGVTDPFDPKQNVMGASRYLKSLVERYEGDLKMALAAYNWGMGNLERRPDRLPTETINYIAKIMALIPGEDRNEWPHEAGIAKNDNSPSSRTVSSSYKRAAEAYGQTLGPVEAAAGSESGGLPTAIEADTVVAEPAPATKA